MSLRTKDEKVAESKRQELQRALDERASQQPVEIPPAKPWKPRPRPVAVMPESALRTRVRGDEWTVEMLSGPQALLQKMRVTLSAGTSDEWPSALRDWRTALYGVADDPKKLKTIVKTVQELQEVVDAFSALSLDRVQRLLGGKYRNLPQFLSADQAAEQTGIPAVDIERWRERKLLRGIEVHGKWLVERQELADFLSAWRAIAQSAGDNGLGLDMNGLEAKAYGLLLDGELCDRRDGIQLTAHQVANLLVLAGNCEGGCTSGELRQATWMGNATILKPMVERGLAHRHPATDGKSTYKWYITDLGHRVLADCGWHSMEPRSGTRCARCSDAPGGQTLGDGR